VKQSLGTPVDYNSISEQIRLLYLHLKSLQI